MSTTTVHIFASHPVAAAHYRRALESEHGIRVTPEQDPFDVGVFDSELPALDAVLQVVRVRLPLMKAVLLSADCDESTCLHWILRGMWGLVSYGRYEHELPSAVRQVAAGHLWMPPRVVIRCMQVDAARRASGPGDALTCREHEVLQLLQRRLSNKEIASILRITERTAKFHVGNILDKLNLRSRQQVFAA